MTERGIWVSAAVALLLVTLLCLGLKPGRIERDVAGRAQAALQGAGYAWATVGVDGRNVDLWGAAPDASSVASAVAVAQAVRGVRSVGDHTMVSVSLVEAPVQVAATDLPQASAAVDMAAPRYTRAEESALSRRISPRTCQRLFNALLAMRSVQFDAGSAAIGTASEPLLRHLATAAVHCPDARLEVAGHTDGSGDDELNLRLSQERAQAVVDFLVAQGARAERLSAIGFGASAPVASNRTEAGRAENRRIEITVLN